jgi:phospholipid/cholesterol/gamma-HCH transport system permease protein
MKQTSEGIESRPTGAFTIHKTGEGVFALGGDLTIDYIKDAARQFGRIVAQTPDSLCFNGSGVGKVDTAGALLLAHFRRVLPSIRYVGFSGDAMSLLALVEKVNPSEAVAPVAPQPFLTLLKRLGMGTVNALETTGSILCFFGRVVVFFFRNLRHPSYFRFGSVARHIQETGVDALPIVALVSFLMSVVLAYQGTFQLRPFGASSFTVNLVAVSVLREMGGLLTAIMVAGRSGSAFTAEIGVMKVNEEIDALSMIGIEPFDILVLPRILALLITLPLLTFVADICGMLGGYVNCAMVLDLSWQQYWEQVRHAIHISSFMVGMLKAPFFAMIIAVVGCRLGLQVSGSAESVGIFTTRSVVESIFIVLTVDALFSILFAQIGW